jgi:hypothetical protein
MLEEKICCATSAKSLSSFDSYSGTRSSWCPFIVTSRMTTTKMATKKTTGWACSPYSLEKCTVMSWYLGLAHSAAAAFKFFQEIDKCESRHRAEIPAAITVTDRVPDEILIEALMLGITDFYTLENEELSLLVQEAIKPRNSMKFAKNFLKP